MGQIGPFVLLATFASAITFSQGLLVLGPKFFRSNQNFTVVMSRFDTKIPKLKVQLVIEGYKNDGTNTLSLSRQATLESNSYSMATFTIPPKLPVGFYKLTVSSEQDRSLKQEINLVYRDHSLAGLIQLSKPVFKPGDNVQFRAIVLDSDLKPPVEVTNVQVMVKDPKENVIRKWSKAHLHVGVFEGDLQISPVPILGAYTIHVTVDDKELATKSFVVKEYVLASFDATVFPSVVPLQRHQGLSLIVAAKYYTGQPVEGTAKVELYLEEDVVDQSKTVKLFGQGQLEFKFNSPYIMAHDEQEVHVTLTFTQKNTNATVVKRENIAIYKHPYRVELIKERPGFHRGLNFNCQLRVLHHNGTAVGGIKVAVDVMETSSDGDVSSMEHGLKTDSEGFIKLSLSPSQSAEMIEVIVNIDSNEVFSESIIQQETGRTFIQVMQPIVTNTSVKLEVKCNEELSYFLYCVVSKGNIAESGFVHSNRKTTHTLQLDAVALMIPKAKLMILTVVDNVVLYDMVDLIFDGFRNSFNLELKRDVIEPGSPVELRLTGNPGAYVALAAYDKSLLQHSKHHDLFWEDIVNTFNGFHEISENEYDIFNSIGLFARSFLGVMFPFATKQSSRAGQDGKLSSNRRKLVSFRTNFLESWLWQNLTIGKQGHSLVQQKAPDTTTAWHLTGFSIDPVLGLGIVPRPLEFTTTQPFYVADSLPYSIKRGEVVILQFIIFNNNKNNVTVTLYNVDEQLEFVGRPAKTDKYAKTVSVSGETGVPVSFLVKPRKLGELEVRVEAASREATDTIVRVIRVEPESLLRQEQISRFFCHDSYINQTFTLATTTAQRADKGSQKILFSLTPNILTSVTQNLQDLLSVPTGCGEQNMVRFVPNLVVLDYLTATGSKDARVKEKVMKLLRQGYQNQMKYRQSDGSFGVWSSSGGSVFLTAFVGKSLQAASKYLSEVEPTQLSKAYDWLASKQQSSGRFDEVGKIIHKDMQGGLRNGIALTAYVLSALLEHRDSTTKHKKMIDKGIQYLTSNLQSTENSYDLSIATYALMLYGHSSKDAFLQKLIGMSTAQNNGTEMFWKRNSGGIETTAYALLSFVQAEKYVDGTKIMRWLVKQRYATGSFPRTQDTFVGLKALAQLTEKISPARNDYSVELILPNVTRQFRISSKALSRLTHEEAVEDVTKLAANVAGIGFGLMELSYEYSVDLRNLTNHFELELEKTLTNSGQRLDLRVCVSFIPTLSESLSNMVLVEVNFPSGYVLNPSPISKASKHNPIKNTEIRHGKTSVVVYYDNMGTEPNCFTVTANRIAKVALKRPAYVLVHDYYEPELRALKMYEVDSHNICDICDDIDCPSECNN